MAAINILQVVENITESAGNYCCVCYRTVAERKLVEPVHFKKFLDNLKNYVPFKVKFKVCYVCESLAATAQRFSEAVQLASRVADLYQDIRASGTWPELVECVKDPPKHLNRWPATNLLRRALNIDQTLRATPRYELYKTETLVVGSGSRRGRKKPPLTECDDVVIIDGDAPSPSPSPPVTSAPAPHPKAAQHQISVLPDRASVQVFNNQTHDVVLHPVVKGVDGNMYVPTLQLQVLDNGIVKSIPNVHLQNNLPPLVTPVTLTYDQTKSTNQTTKSKNTNVNQNASKPNKNTDLNVTKVTSERNHLKVRKDLIGLNNVDIIKTNSMNIVLNKKRRIEEDPLKISGQNVSQVQTLLNENAIGGCEITIIEDDSNPAADGSAAGSRPVLKADRTVDWEDKIPMDVISFMDATDPNPEERIMQPPRPVGMGFISDVRTVPEDVHSRQCVDLC